MVEIHPPPNFQAAAPARSPRKGPSIVFLLPLWFQDLIFVAALRDFQGALEPLTLSLRGVWFLIYVKILSRLRGLGEHHALLMRPWILLDLIRDSLHL
jgi:hypothetical protein